VEVEGVGRGDVRASSKERPEGSRKYETNHAYITFYWFATTTMKYSMGLARRTPPLPIHPDATCARASVDVFPPVNLLPAERS